jgi:hypothetical protein
MTDASDVYRPGFDPTARSFVEVCEPSVKKYVGALCVA